MAQIIERKTPRFLEVLLFLAVFLIFFLPPIDTDLGWHLRYGDYFLENGRPLAENTLSTLMAGYHWPNPYTFYQPLLALVHRQFGFLGLSFLNGLIFAGIFALIYRLLGKNLLGAVFTLLVLGAGSWPVLGLGLRAQITSLLFVTFLLYLLEHLRSSWWLLVVLPILFALWVNFHGGFILGLILVAVWSCSKLVRALLDAEAGRPTNWLMVILAPVFSFFGSLASPYGFENYRFVFQHLTTPLDTLILEWTPPTRGFIFEIALLFGGYLYLLASRRLWRRELFWVIATSLSAYLAVTARRNLPFFFLIGALALVRVLKRGKPIRNLSEIQKKLLAWTGIFGVLFVGAFLVLPWAVRMDTNWETYCQFALVRFPCRAVAFAKERQLQGSVFNMYEWGGYLAWQLPDNKVFVDGRMPAWPHPSGKSPYTLFLEVIQARPGYQATLDENGISWLLIGPGSFLDLELKGRLDVSWQESYRDPQAVIYMRR